MAVPRPHLLLLAPLVVACVEYGVAPKSQEPPEDDTVPAFQPPLPVDSADPGPVGCDAATITATDAVASPPFGGETDPEDVGGRPFHAPAFEAGGWSSVDLPDVGGIPAGQDRAYRVPVVVQGTPPAVFLDLQSDDGIIVWIDGQRLGAWGGAYQQEGCVNDDANCLDTIEVPPLDVTDRLTEGEHLVAFRVSNPVENSYAFVGVNCQESP